MCKEEWHRVLCKNEECRATLSEPSDGIYHFCRAALTAAAYKNAQRRYCQEFDRQPHPARIVRSEDMMCKPCTRTKYYNEKLGWYKKLPDCPTHYNPWHGCNVCVPSERFNYGADKQ